jgi:kumamolisin
MSMMSWGFTRAAVIAAATALAVGLIATAGASAAAAAGAGAAAVAPGIARGAMAPSTRSARSARTARDAARAPAAADRRIAVLLPLSTDAAGLARFATAVSTPGSPLYGRYESIATLARRFGASAPRRVQVVGFLRRAGATGVEIDPTGLFARATMTLSLADRLFSTSLGVFHSARATRFVAPVGGSRIPAGLRTAVTGVVGLDTAPLATAPQLLTAPATARSASGERSDVASFSGYPNRTGTAAGCPAATSQQGFTPNQYLAAYGYTPLHQANISGQGERVALIEIDGFSAADLDAFASCFGLAAPPIQTDLVGLSHPLPAGGESTLDLEVLDAAAPRLREIDIYESGPTATDVLASLTRPLVNRRSRADVISASLGACEAATVQAIGRSGVQLAESALAMAAASGISVLASSGDEGSSSCLGNDGKPLPDLSVSYPASSPWVTGVGGTNFTLGPSNAIVSQDVWNDLPLVQAAGGGGSSSLFRRPSYQDSFQGPDRRGVPDVSMLSDVLPGYEIYCTVARDCVSADTPGPWTQVGGTSAAAPLLAGGLALIDQDLRLQGRQDLGLANPLLYDIDRLPQGPAVISDVTVNSNDLGSSIDGSALGCCDAIPGYDRASGLGSVNMAALAFAASAIVPKIVAVRVAVPGQRRPVAQRRLLARVSCSGRCLMGAWARITVGRSRRAIAESSRPYVLRGAGARTIAIALSPSDLSRLRSALAARQAVTATVYGVILDPSGDVEAQSRGARLRITG